MIVAQGKVVLEGYAQNDLDGEAILGFSDTGLATPALIQAWLRKFNAKSFELSPSFRGFKLEEWFDTERNGMPGTTRRQPERPAIYRMLLSDGYFSHLELPFIEFCAEYEIIPFCFPPHLTHLIQPLDVSVFGVFKHQHKISIENNVRHGNLDFSLFDFLEVFQSFHRESFSYHTILSGWRATGLDPKHINSSMVVSRLGSFLGRQKEKKGEMPVVEPPETPPRVQGVATAINGLTALRDKYGTLLSSPSRHVLEQTSVHLNRSLVMDRTLEAYEKSATERLNRRKSRRQVKTPTGHIELSQIREKIEARDAEERRKLMRQQEVMVNKLRNEHIKENKKAMAAEKKAHRAARRAVGIKVKFVTLKLEMSSQPSATLCHSAMDCLNLVVACGSRRPMTKRRSQSLSWTRREMQTSQFLGPMKKYSVLKVMAIVSMTSLSCLRCGLNSTINHVKVITKLRITDIQLLELNCTITELQ